VRELEKKFVMNLKDHLGLQVLFRQTAVDIDHGHFDDVGGGALQRRVERGALGEVAQLELRGINFGDGANSSE